MCFWVLLDCFNRHRIHKGLQSPDTLKYLALPRNKWGWWRQGDRLNAIINHTLLGKGQKVCCPAMSGTLLWSKLFCAKVITCRCHWSPECSLLSIYLHSSRKGNLLNISIFLKWSSFESPCLWARVNQHPPWCTVCAPLPPDAKEIKWMVCIPMNVCVYKLWKPHQLGTLRANWTWVMSYNLHAVSQSRCKIPITNWLCSNHWHASSHLAAIKLLTCIHSDHFYYLPIYLWYFRGAFILGVRDSSVKSLNTMLVI